jgi:hypothetical protein
VDALFIATGTQAKDELDCGLGGMLDLGHGMVRDGENTVRVSL